VLSAKETSTGMFSILVNEKGGESKRLEFDKPEVTIGRVQGNDIILPKGNVSKRHSRIVLKDGKFIIVDLKSTNGTYVNGRKITSPLVVKNTDKVYIGDFILSIEEPGAAAADPEPAPPPRAQVAPPQPTKPRTLSSAGMPPPPPRRLEEDDPAAADEAEAADSHFAPEAPEEPVPEPPPARRPTQQAPVQPPRPAVTPPPAARPAEPPRPSVPSRADVPAIAPSRPVATSRPPIAAPPPAAPPPAAPQASAPVAVAPARSKPVSAVSAPIPPRKPTLPAITDGADQSRRGRIIESLRHLASRLHAALGEDGSRLSGDALRERAESHANELVGELAQESGLPPGIEPDQLLRDAVAEVIGLGPLDELLADESVQTITITRHDRIHVDRQGQGRSLAPRWVSSPDALSRIVERVAARAGRLDELNESRRHGGMFEARLGNGFTLSAVVGAISPSGAAIVVRRGRRDTSRLTDLAQQGMLSPGMADFLDLAVSSRRSIAVAGPPGSGRSTLIGALARATGGQRVVAIEESPELDGGDLSWISITAAGSETRRAFAAALRLKPERLVVGDVRGPEALDLVSALAGGMDGALIGVTASSPRDALLRLSALARMAHEAPSADQINAEIGAGVQLVVFLGRGAEGEPRVQEIGEVTFGADGLAVTAVFSLRGDGASARFAASGHVPAWAESAPASMFRA
jgi:pilus assembly protein CpaF